MTVPRPPAAPDFQEFVEGFGGYDKITREAWAEWDSRIKEWRQARRDFYLDLRSAVRGLAVDVRRLKQA